MVVKFVSFFLRRLGLGYSERCRADSVPYRYFSGRMVAAHLANCAKPVPVVAPQHPEDPRIRVRVAPVKRVVLFNAIMISTAASRLRVH